MKQRCLNKNNHAYKDYGGRGITIFDPWIESFELFLAHVGTRPSLKHSIDRINNDGNYEPGNVRWVTQDVQVLNQRPRQLKIYLDKREKPRPCPCGHGMIKKPSVSRMCQSCAARRGALAIAGKPRRKRKATACAGGTIPRTHVPSQ